MAILTLTCPACQKLFSFTTHPAFDTGEDASIAEKVRTGEAFVGACPHCGHAEHYSYSFLYKERESHALLYYADNEEDFRKACAIMTGRDPSVPWAGIADWSRRVVANRQVLLEKLLLLDLHLDDRVIEIMKVLAHSFLQKQKPGLLVDAIWFERGADGRTGYCLYQDGKIVCAYAFDAAMYEQVKQQLSPAFAKTEREDILIDASWAAKLLKKPAWECKSDWYCVF